jgi:RND family efflux transporter MFP subunit
VIAERLAAPGALVNPQTPLLTLVPPALELVVNVDEAHLAQVMLGQAVRVEVAAFPGQTFAASVRSISPTVDSKSRTAPIHIQPADDVHQLKPGMFAQLSIVTAQKQNTLLVPQTALLGGDSQARVVTIDSANTARFQPIKLGLQSDGFAEIVGGLDEGQLVATSGLSTLHDGDAVAPRLDNLTALAPQQQ